METLSIKATPPTPRPRDQLCRFKPLHQHQPMGSRDKPGGIVDPPNHTRSDLPYSVHQHKGTGAVLLLRHLYHLIASIYSPKGTPYNNTSLSDNTISDKIFPAE